MSGRGKPAELAVLRAANRYRREGRCALVRQEPRISAGPDGTVIRTGTAAIDFVGCHGREAGARALCIEVKSTHRSAWPLSEIRSEQIAALDLFASLGADCRLVVAFEAQAESYILGWPTVSKFIADPWRESLSVAWCRAFGLVIEEQDRSDPGKRLAPFLDAQEHASAALARVAVIEEREAALSRPARPEPSQEALELPPATYVAPSEEERRQRIMAACSEGIGRQLAKAARAQRFAPRGRR